MRRLLRHQVEKGDPLLRLAHLQSVRQVKATALATGLCAADLLDKLVVVCKQTLRRQWPIRCAQVALLERGRRRHSGNHLAVVHVVVHRAAHGARLRLNARRGSLGLRHDLDIVIHLLRHGAWQLLRLFGFLLDAA